MNLNVIPFLLAIGATSDQGQSTAPFYVQMVPMILMVGVLYFIMIRPGQKKAKEHAELLKTVKPGDKVLTASGIIGVIIGVKEKSVNLRSADTKLEVLKSAISEITDRNGAVES
ncbi:MAG: preprotein translocase subunit YajC [Verrucomicrobiota bacterium]|nr:preprotein translocase subunit YajC [Verrucomicrobiota bacterium]